MSYSEVHDKIEASGLEATFLDLFKAAEAAESEVIRLREELSAAKTEKGISASNLEDLIKAVSRKEEYKDLITKEGSLITLRVASNETLYVVEIIGDDPYR